jgi:hypothetical protein
MIRYQKIRLRMKNPMVTLKGKEVPEEYCFVGEISFFKEEEEVEEVKLNVMHVEKHDMCLGNSPRGIKKKEDNHTFLKLRRMWK